jgi:hypothetical protein
VRIRLWVISMCDGVPVYETEHEAFSIAEAVYLAEKYRNQFGDNGIVRMYPGTALSEEELSSLREKVASRRLSLVSVFS